MFRKWPNGQKDDGAPHLICFAWIWLGLEMRADMSCIERGLETNKNSPVGENITDKPSQYEFMFSVPEPDM